MNGGECYARKSASALRQILTPGTAVRLRADPRLDKTDRFGRQLRYIFKGSKNVNLLLVQRGVASVWFFEGDRGRYAGRLLRAAQQAQQARRGLWRACAATELDPLRALTTAKPPPPEPEPASEEPSSNCDPNYAGACVPPYPPDVDCDDVGTSVTIVGNDPHGLDGNDNDGLGCESY